MPRAGRIAIVGRPNVGKSTLLNALCGEPIAITSRHPQTTRDRIAGVVTQGATQFVFVDTPGLHRPRTKLGARMNHLAEDAPRSCDAVVFVCDPPPPGAPTGTAMRDVDLAILRSLPDKVPVVLALNKIDRVKDKAALLPILESFGGSHPFSAIVPVSALKKSGTDRLLKELAKLLPRGDKLYGDDEISDKPARFFVAEYVREQILRRTREEVPHGVAVVVERWDETGKMPKIDLVVHVDKPSHNGIVIGAKGAMLKSIGIDARKRVEHLLGGKVHLGITVRVTPGWYESDARLRDLGYGDDA